MISKILTKLNEPWLVTSEVHAALSEIVRLHLAGVEGLAEDQPEAEVQIDGNIAILPVKGVMTQAPSAFEKIMLGATDTDQITKSARQLAFDDSVEGVLLDIDSGGGSVAGVIEAANSIKSLAKKKPVVAYAGGVAASAAYWIASQADIIIATDSARLGSLGVYIPFVDASKAFSMEGLEVDVIKNAEGVHKGAGYYGTSLSEAQREQMQVEVQEIFDCFISDVKKGRKSLADNAAMGQTFMAKSAKGAGLVDVVGGEGDALAVLFAEIRRRKRD